MKPYDTLIGIEQARRLIREKWTDGHRVFWSMTDQDLIIEMPSVDLKVFCSNLKKGWFKLHAQADLEYIAGYWK